METKYRKQNSTTPILVLGGFRGPNLTRVELTVKKVVQELIASGVDKFYYLDQTDKVASRPDGTNPDDSGHTIYAQAIMAWASTVL
ncbi:MAG: hypothetical protein RSC07_00600 [Mucinivorans sp.]